MAAHLKKLPLYRSLMKEVMQGRRHACTDSRLSDGINKMSPVLLHKLDVQGNHSQHDFNRRPGLLNCLTVNNQQIGDFPLSNVSYECPKIPSMNFEITPPPCLNKVKPLDDPKTNQIKRRSPGVETPAKEASVRMRIRHKKMKKHQLKRLRERTWPIIRKTRHLKHIKKMRIYNNKLATLRGYGTEFDAMDFVQTSVSKARDKGYFINILGPHSQSFRFKDMPEEKKEQEPDLAAVLQGMTVKGK